MKFDAHQFWVGKIPSHWNWNRVGDNFEVLNGFPFESSFFNSNGEGMPLVRIRDILSSDFGTFYSGQSGLSTTVEDEDIVIGMDGDFNSCWWTKGAALLNQRVAALRSKKNSDLDGRYAHYQIPFGLKIINDLTPSSTVKHLSSGDIAALRLPSPTLPTQKRIATFLDRETARIDALIAKKERLIAVLAQNQFSAISRALTVGLDTAAEKLATGSKYIPEVPKGWTVWRLKHLAHAYGGITLGRKISKDVTTIPTPYLRVANVQAGRLDLTDVAEIEATHLERDRYALRKGDVLMNEGGDNDKLGRGAVWHAPFEPCLNQNHVFVVRPHDLRFSEWISMATNARYARDFFYLHSNQSTNLASISKTNLEKLPIAVPPMDEMLATMEALTARLTVLRKTEQATLESIHRLREYRAALITAAVTGQIDVETYDRSAQPEADTAVIHLHDGIATRVQPDRRKLRTLVAAEVIHRHGSRARLGRIKMQKLMFLAEAHANLNAIAGSYQRYRHGPYDADMVAEIETSLRKAGYYDATEIGSSSGRKVEYRRMATAGGHSNELEDVVGDKAADLRSIIDKFADMNTKFTEGVATLYAVWNDALMDGQTPDDDAIVEGFRRDWHENKLKFRENDLHEWLSWMRRNDLVPRGTGPRTIPTSTPSFFENE